MIPRASVLDKLKDEMSGKVLEFDWGVGQWAGLLLGSNVDHPVDLEDPAIFEPRLLGTHEACTGLYACQRHDQAFNPVDTDNPDFADPHLRWLKMGRIALYAADLCSRRKSLVDTCKSKTIRSGNRGLRVSWVRESQLAYTACEMAHFGAEKWRGMFESFEAATPPPEDLISWSVHTFRSRLRVAGCLYYGQATAVVVLPGEGEQQGKAMLHWGEDSSRVEEDQKRLATKAKDTDTSDEYGVELLSELMSRGSGSVAASPASYRE